MKGFRLWLGAVCALTLAACGGGGPKSPDFEPVLLSITVTPGTASLGTGETQQFTAVGTFTNEPGHGESTRDITNEVNWSSDNTAVATISDAGVATATGQGTATLTASKGGVSDSAVLTGEGRVLRSVVITPATAVSAPNGTASYTAAGVYSDSPAPTTFDVGQEVAWTISPALGTLSPNGENVSVKAGTDEGTATLTATVAGIAGTAKFIVGRVTGIRVEPSTASKPVGLPQEFTAIASFATTASGGTIPDQAVPAAWTATLVSGTTAPALDSSCASSATPTNTCLVTGKSVGEVKVTASYLTFSDDATLTVTEAILKGVTIESLDPNVTITGSSPRSADVPLGAAPSFRAIYTYTDDISGAARNAADKVSWSLPSTSSIATLAVDSATNVATVTTTAKGTTTLTATAPASITDSVQLVIGDAAVTSLLGVRPVKAYVATGRTQEFIAVGKFSDNTQADLPDSSVTWSSDDTAIATVAATGIATAIAEPTVAIPTPSTKIRAKLNSNPASEATADFVVTSNRCSIPLLATDGASAAAAPSAGVCLLCGTNNEDKVVDALPLTYGQINMGVGVLNGYRGIDVTIGPAAPYMPIPAGATPAFIVGVPTGSLVLADVLAQLEISTLMNGAVVQSSAEGIPLRVDLLGTTLIDVGDSQDQFLVAIDTTEVFNGVRLKLKSGTASALTTVNVFGACGDSEPVAPTLNGIGSIERVGVDPTEDNHTGSVGIGITFRANSLTGQDIPAADVTWTSSNHSVMPDPNGSGAATPIGAGTTTVTATLVDKSLCTSACSATYTLTVVQNYCETSFTAANSTVSTSNFGLLCVLCGVTDASNVIDGLDATSATMNVVAGLLGAGTSVRVTSTSATPYPAGNQVAFLLNEPVAVLKAELLSQLIVRTYRSGAVVDTFNNLTVLDLDLLGINVDGNDVVSVLRLPPATAPFDAVELSFNSGVLSAVTTVKVFSACASTTPIPAP